MTSVLLRKKGGKNERTVSNKENKEDSTGE
jgi:hypothetical protein